MKTPILLWVIAGLVLAGPALASGIELSVGSCTGSPGAQTGYANLQCAGGQDFVLVLTFEPAEDISDLVAADWILDALTSNDVHSDGNFWDWQTANASAFSLSRTIPPPQCVGFKTDAWSALNSGDSWAAAVLRSNRVRRAGSVFRPSDLAVTANQKLFLARMLLHTNEAVEAGGDLRGCCQSQITLALLQVSPVSAHSNPTTILSSSAGATLEATPATNCVGSVGTNHRSWGALKSLCR